MDRLAIQRAMRAAHCISHTSVGLNGCILRSAGVLAAVYTPHARERIILTLIFTLILPYYNPNMTPI